MAYKKTTKEMMAAVQGNRSPRELAGRNRKVNQVRKRSKHLDMGIYAKPRTPANRARKA